MAPASARVAAAALAVAALASLATGAAPRLARLHMQTLEVHELLLDRDALASRREWRLARISVSFNQPLFVRGLDDDARRWALRESGLNASLDDALRLECGARVGSARLEGSWERATAFWDQSTLSLRLLPARDDRNPLAAALHAFDDAEVENLEGAARPEDSNTLELLVPMSLRWSGAEASRVLAEEELRGCVLRYVPAAQRALQANSPQGRGGAGAGGGRLTSPEPLADLAPHRMSNGSGVFQLASYGGEEIVLEARLSEAHAQGEEPACVRRSFVRLLDLDHWLNASEQTWEARGKGTHDRFHPASSIALLDAKSEVGMPLAKMFKPVMSGVMKPVIKATTDLMASDLMSVFVEQMVTLLTPEVWPDVSIMLTETLTANLTDILTDSVTHLLTKSLAKALTRALGPYLVNALHEKVTPITFTILDNVLQEKIPKELDNFLPDILDRTLPLTLTHSLTRSVTHALTATLTSTLTHSRVEDTACHDCFYKQQRCEFCHFSANSLYYHAYHSAYFADYFSNYYAQYYAEALQKIDVANFPETRGDQEAQ